MDVKLIDKCSLKIGDEIKFSLSIETQIPEEDETKEILWDDDYKHNYSIYYAVNNEHVGSFNFTLDEGFYPSFGDDIEECVKEEMEETFPEVADYEIFDVDNKGGEYKTAKVRVKAIKE